MGQAHGGAAHTCLLLVPHDVFQRVHLLQLVLVSLQQHGLWLWHLLLEEQLLFSVVLL